MPVLKWNEPPKPVVDKHRVEPALAHGNNVAVQSQAFGDPVGGQLAVESIGDHIQPASLYSTAPYKPDGLHYEDPRAKRCTANDNTCQGFATKRWPGLCAAHGLASEKAPPSWM